MQSITRPGVMIKMANILQKKMSEKERGIKIRNEIYDIILCTTYRASSKIGLQIMGGNGKIVGDHFGQDIKKFFLHRQKKLLFLCYTVGNLKKRKF